MKNTFAKIVLRILPLAVVNALFFYLLGTENSTTQWICYGFFHLAYLSVLTTPLFTRSNRKRTNTASLWYISGWYFFLELIPSFVCIWVNPEDYTWPLITQAGLFVVYAFWFLITYIANNHINEAIAEQKMYSTRIKSLAIRIKTIKSHVIEGGSNYEQLEKNFLKISGSPIKSCKEIQPIEESISILIDELELAITTDNTADISTISNKLNLKIDERNNTLKFIH